MQHVKQLAEKYSHEELEKCIADEINNGKNVCFTGETEEDTMNTLSKASYIRRLVAEGKAENVLDGLRKLAAQIRSVQQGKS